MTLALPTAPTADRTTGPVVAYARVSLDRTGEGLAVDRQLVEVRALAERLGLTIDRERVDNDLSATSGVERPQFEAMLAERPSAILVWHQDRLLRLTRDLERVLDLGVPVHSVAGGTLDLTTPAGRAVARTVAAWSQYEGEQKSERQRAANRQRAERGMPSSRAGYGYRRLDGADVVEAAEAAIIREAAERILTGESLHGVARDLNERGIPSPSGSAPWSTATLRQMLRRPSLAGLRVHRGQVVGSSAAEAILDLGTRERLEALFTDPARLSNTLGPKPRHLLSGLARCGRCGGTMRYLTGWVAKRDDAPTKHQPPAYACRECHKVRRKAEPLDAFVVEIVMRHLERADDAGILTRGDEGAVAEARTSIAAIDARLASAADLFAAGSIDDVQLRRITERLRTERGVAEAALTAALPPAIPAGLVGEGVRDAWANLAIEVQRAVVEHLLTVTVLPTGPGRRGFDPDAVRVEWNATA